MDKTHSLLCKNTMIEENKLQGEQEVTIANKIILTRDEQVILDAHPAELYGVETRVLKQAVRRNRDRFPDDFVYE